MGTHAVSAPALAPDAAPAGRRTLTAFAAATFLGAFLLFLVQPLIAKYLLPCFGGGAAVWTTCMLFFQVVLLAGYAYAHGGVSRLSARSQAMVHIALLAAAAALLLPLLRGPPSVPSGAHRSELAPLGQMLLLLAASVGLPALALSATSPLLNAWYARAAPASGANVYRLYAVSNAGSLLALVAYPFAVEPALSRRSQVLLWSAGFGAFAVLCGYCALRAARAGATGPLDAHGAGPDDRSDAAARLLWLALPACATVLLLATTNTMTHDVAAVPMLWVLPLALYLLTFVLAFDARRWYRRSVAGVPLAAAAAGMCWVLLGADVGSSAVARITLLAASMFVCCMVCHGELAALKPPPRELTAYYLTIAAGGALGGALVAVVAPLVLDRYAELHVGLWACCLLALVAPYAARPAREKRRQSGLLAMLGIAGLVVLGAVLWAARDPYSSDAGAAVARARDFYGVVTVYEADADDPRRARRIIRHAGITHGLQFLSPEKRRTPTTYYTAASGAGAALQATGDAGRPRHVGVIGLGAGTLAAWGATGDTFRFYELSPTVERIAREQFTFLADCPARCDVVLGDARLSLEREPPQAFDVLIIDAFSGHAIPVHLLTREAFALYRRHVAAGGVLAVHVSNSFVNLEPVVAQQAAAGGWGAVILSSGDGDELDGMIAADWVLLCDDAAKLAAFRRAGARPPRVDSARPLWTDDYVSLYHVLR